MIILNFMVCKIRTAVIHAISMLRSAPMSGLTDRSAAFGCVVNGGSGPVAPIGSITANGSKIRITDLAGIRI